ncbi:creatinine amidohydrolase [Cohaesibacter sp. ES.047]|uniref:creatininase family protein n=1 Tax=Cohaesibacter sp. ES.047 TaxID=1798205 RepID=UPI000BBFBC01|nr:creatininase family protein [Cohaesibacter sp. ES.047]SNY90913.1 creatinine amidohydrolase [Cohaesibacter sp. ES.047]
MVKAYWRDMGRDDFSKPGLEGAVAVLPIAAIEQHGPHLPLGTDAILAEGYMERVVADLPSDLDLIFLPVQQIGWSEEHLDGTGTLTSSWKHLLPVWLDICLSVKRAGIQRLILINSHGGNVPLMEILMQDLRVHHGMLVSATNWLRFGYPADVFDLDEISFGIHGGDVETSLMLALAPELVSMQKADDFSSAQRLISGKNEHLRYYGRKAMGWMATDLNAEGVTGNATAATAEKGEKLLAHITKAFIDYAREVRQMPVPGERS